MTTSTGKTGRGVTIEIGDGQSPETFETVANVVSINNQGRTSEQIDFTTLATTGGFREYRQGFKDPGTVQCEYHIDPTNTTHQDILTKWLSGDTFTARINFTGAGWSKALQGTAFVQNPGDIQVDISNPIKGTTTLRFTGETDFVDI